MKLKPFFVELKVTAVVMAESEAQAMVKAESSASSIISDEGISAEHAEQVESLAEVRGLDPKWTGDSIPYGGDGTLKLKDLLPETAAVRDTHTIDMFENA